MESSPHNEQSKFVLEEVLLYDIDTQTQIRAPLDFIFEGEELTSSLLDNSSAVIDLDKEGHIINIQVTSADSSIQSSLVKDNCLYLHGRFPKA